MTSHFDASRDSLMAPDSHVEGFRKARDARRTELFEDYVELIADLIATKGEARAVEVAQRMGVTQATVARMIRRLVDKGLVKSEPYRAIFLTSAGDHIARAARDRHVVVLRFLKALGVSDASARQDAEGIEHHVCSETLEIMRDFAAHHDKNRPNG